MVEPFLQCVDHRPHLREEKQPPLIKLAAEDNYSESLFVKEDEQDKKLSINFASF
jgi:hypothetical protein